MEKDQDMHNWINFWDPHQMIIRSRKRILIPFAIAKAVQINAKFVTNGHVMAGCGQVGIPATWLPSLHIYLDPTGAD